MSAIGMTCKLKNDTIVVNGDLRISFRRTVRVSDTEESNYLPLDLGAFPLKPVSRHRKDMPPGMVAKGGVFFPMYQYEAMWINFSTVHEHKLPSEDMLPYMIKIYAGGMNVISAEPAIESIASRSRRQARLQTTSSDPEAASPLQDYIVVPGQDWIDGIANEDGTVRQFVATPLHSGLSVEAQTTREDAVAVVQIEITPYRLLSPREFPGTPMQIFLKHPNGTTSSFNVTNLEPIGNFKLRIREATGSSISVMRLIYAGKRLEDGRDFESYRISNEAAIHLFYRLTGGGPAPMPTSEMNIAAGGLIKQVIHRDRYRPNWDTTKTTVFNAQILNSTLYQEITGARPPTLSTLHETYTARGFPYYKMYEEPSGIHGNFGWVQSVGQITGEAASEAETKAPRIVEIGEAHTIVNPQGSLRESGSTSEPEASSEGYHVASF